MTDEPAPAERALYRAAVRAGGRLRPDDLAPADRAAFAALVARGLLTATPTGWTAANPRALGDRIGAELRTRATRLLQHAERLSATLAPLTPAYEAVRRPHGPGEAVHVDGTAAIRRRISRLVSECREELLAARPGPHPADDDLRTTLAQDLSLLRRGCAVRALHQPAALTEHTVQRRLALRARHGARVRLLAEPYERLLVFDRKVAVIPAASDHTSAAVVDDPSTVAFVVDTFEQLWERAEGLNWSASAAGSTEPPTHHHTARLLAQGLTQRAIATRLGLSERTVAGHIARLRESYDAETLFQLGWQMRGARDA
ncbi:helix-turn-helix domain-containing protein [Kitasatospora sp. NPDC093550]|uniref:helix-turn-helix transcriptional regulator n=1 Tax=Kitasatospora sp. NPDC093550 TaxID=3364089 RepID=UPI00381EFE3B